MNYILFIASSNNIKLYNYGTSNSSNGLYSKWYDRTHPIVTTTRKTSVVSVLASAFILYTDIIATGSIQLS